MWCLSNIAWGIRCTGQEATIKEVPEPSHFLEYLLVSLQRLRNHQRESNRRAEDQSSKNCNSREVAEVSRQWIKNHEDRLLSWPYPMGRDVICPYLSISTQFFSLKIVFSLLLELAGAKVWESYYMVSFISSQNLLSGLSHALILPLLSGDILNKSHPFPLSQFLI